MPNSEIYLKASNNNFVNGDAKIFCKICKKITIHQIYKNGLIECKACNCRNRNLKAS